jgi:hypothetical protein
MLDNGIADIERVKNQLRHGVDYYDMGEDDQVLFRQHTCYLKTIVTGWSLASSQDQAAFRVGATPPSTLASSIREARRLRIGQ